MRGFLLGVLEAVSCGVRFAAAWGGVLLFIAVSGASVAGAHVPMAVVR